ncbi:cysteine hydrolase family protein [Caldisericum exile]|uniref:Hydrolase n=1 Tax=Caldisericum exile (strain DSM 21853 / NBRC 104410 / AZM16c01) TaxID=511051 RepID=A0A7U6GE71_CALEA|nr:isochorismatase family cysteine hydrolase [Caldisericum exile]BAL80746.1 putative hydrolase [Caldisericum exile AZM16c01]
MKALIIVDMLKDFVYDWGTLRINGAKDIIPYIHQLKTQFKKENFPVIYLADSHDKYDKEFEIWPPHCVEGTEGAEVVDELKPDESDIIIKKKTYSGFFKTELEETLKKLNIDELYIVGVATNICVHYTASDAVLRGYRVLIPWKGTKGITEEDEIYMKKHFENVLKVKII